MLPVDTAQKRGVAGEAHLVMVGVGALFTTTLLLYSTKHGSIGDMTQPVWSICNQSDTRECCQPYATVTAQGIVKKTRASEFVSIQKNGKKALGLRRGDRLKHVGVVHEVGRCTLTPPDP
jgi:hypothetical protein